MTRLLAQTAKHSIINISCGFAKQRKASDMKYTEDKKIRVCSLKQSKKKTTKWVQI